MANSPLVMHCSASAHCPSLIRDKVRQLARLTLRAMFRRWLIPFIALLLATAPMVSLAAKAQRGTMLQELCAPSGAKILIAVDLGIKAPDASHDQHDCCGACGPAGASGLAHALATLPLPVGQDATRYPLESPVWGATARLSDAAPRAPPASL